MTGGLGLAELLRAVCPGGSVTGAPKLAALAEIARLEPVGRGVSMGALGWVGTDHLDLGLSIRTVAADGDRVHLWAGGGITWDSDPVAEVDEAAAKAAPMRAALADPCDPAARLTPVPVTPDSLSAMTVRPIRLFGDPVLRTESDPVTSFDAELRALVADLEDTVREPGRAGVAGAADRGEPAGVLVQRRRTWSGTWSTRCCPTSRASRTTTRAACRCPGLCFPTPRAIRVTATGQDQHGEPLVIKGTGFLARALQHETDHLDGTLYIDTLKGDVRRQALRELRQGRGLRVFVAL